MPSLTIFSRSLFAAAIRWCARILSALIICFWVYFLVGHLTGEAGHATRPLGLGDYIGISTIGASLMGLGLAWKWERVGATVALIAIAIGVAFNWKLLLFPMSLIPMAAVLFLVDSWLRQSSKTPNAPAVQ